MELMIQSWIEDTDILDLCMSKFAAAVCHDQLLSSHLTT